ncbi:MAG: uracil phosphoribosyltransferase [Longimicrobiales bacterium]
MPDLSKLTVIDHPLIRHKLHLLRSVETSRKVFRELVDEITTLMTYEATRSLPVQEVEVRTPLETMVGHRLAGHAPVVVPVLRAGLGMVAGVLTVVPGARVGHVGIKRDHESLQPVEYYFNVPAHAETLRFIVVDPMLATGGSAAATIAGLKARGASQVSLMCLVAAPEGVDRLAREHPDVSVFAAVLDRQLNDKGYILPGLGDAGDRLFGTE